MKVGDAIKLIEQNGWYHVRTRGSHRQFHHPSKPGTVTIAGKPSADIPARTYNSILKQAGLKEKFMRYLVVIERSESSWGAHVPDIPGCVAVGESREEVERLIKEAIDLHLDDLRRRAQPIPAPASDSTFVETSVA